MSATNLSSLSNSEFGALAQEIERHSGLKEVLKWAAGKPQTEVHPRYVADVITQDEFTHDIIVPYRNVFLVYDTT